MQLDLVDGGGAADEFRLCGDGLRFGRLHEHSGRRRALLRQRRAREDRFQQSGQNDGRRRKTPLTHCLRPRHVASANTALFRQNGHGISGSSRRRVSVEWEVRGCCKWQRGSARACAVADAGRRGRVARVRNRRQPCRTRPSRPPTPRRSIPRTRPSAPTGDGDFSRLVSQQRSAHRCLRADHGGVAERRQSGQGRRDRRTNLLQIDPDNMRALANRAYVGRTRAMSGEPAALAPAVGAAERGIAALPKWPKPAAAHRRRLRAHEDADDRHLRRHAGLRGACRPRTTPRRAPTTSQAVGVDPDNLADVYQLVGGAARAAAARSAGLLVWRARHRHRAWRQERAGGERHRQVRALPLPALSRQRGGLGRAGDPRRRRPKDAAGWLREIDLARAVAGRGRGAGRDRQRSRVAVLFGMGIRAGPSRGFRGQQGGGRQGVARHRRQAEGRRAPQDSGEGDHRHARPHRGGDLRREPGEQHRSISTLRSPGRSAPCRRWAP